jgi:glycosyltransferase involved in cell wall biosynthesis
MKILFFARALGPGGAERQMAVTAAGLQRRGHDVVVATFYPGGAFQSLVAEAGARHVNLGKTGRWDVFGFLARFRRFVVQEKPDALYSFLPPANIIAACVSPRGQGMHHIWGVRVSDMKLDRYGWLERLSYSAERHLSNRAEMIAFNSESGQRSAEQRGMAVGRSVVVPNGIDTDVFKPDAVARDRMRRSWDIGDNDRVIGMIGRFDPMKDHPTFLAAAKALAEIRPNLIFVLAGAGVDSANTQLGGLGERSDMPAVMAGLDLLCLSSAYGEGFPNVLGEAMACGVPCAATDVGDSKSIVGETGEIVPPEKSATLSDAMDRLLGRLERSPDEMRRAARARIVDNYSVERLIDRTEALLEQLVQSSATVPVYDADFPSGQ